MPLLTRRLLLATGATGGVGLGSLGYAGAIEPGLRLRVTRYSVRPAGWPAALRLRIAVLADLHAGVPHMGADRIRRVVETTNALAPDLVVLLGDYTASHRLATPMPVAETASLLAALRAPLGVHAVLGNHDWWDDQAAFRGRGWPAIGHTLRAASVIVLENEALRVSHRGQPFWLLGLGDQWAFRGGRAPRGVDDLPGTLAQLEDRAPAILLAHEPDIFPAVPARVALTISGHTHGGQIRILGWSPGIPSRFGDRYRYGHIEEGGRHLLVSAGLGCSVLPVRLGVPPEIVELTLG